MSGFRLAGLLRVRARAEESARAGLATANADSRSAAQQVADRREALRASAVLPDAPAGQWRAALAMRAALAAEVSAATDRAAEARAAADDAAAQWARARGDVRALERLAERHADAEAAREARAEQAAADDRAGTAAYAATRSRSRSTDMTQPPDGAPPATEGGSAWKG